MTPELICLCEGATIKNGSICILHTLANIAVDGFPMTIGAVCVAQVRFMDADDGPHILQFELRDGDGAVLWHGRQRQVRIDCSQRASVIIPFQDLLQLEVHQGGQHELIFKVDDAPVSSCLLAIFDISERK